MRSEVLLCLLMDDVEDRAEDRLAAGAADEEPVDVRQLGQGCGVRLRDRAAVQDARILRDGLGAVLRQPAADRLACLLRLVVARHFAGVQRPDRLVADDDLLPFCPLHGLLDGFEL